MDADEALARMLQEEEARAAQSLRDEPGFDPGWQRSGEGNAGVGPFQLRVQTMMEIALRCEDRGLQQKALAVMPLARLRAAAEEAAALAGRLGADVAAPAVEDLLALGLLRWFKTEFFSWVDTLPCSHCGSDATRPAGGVQPLPSDLAGGAVRVESHRCSACGASTRFPRYNDPGRLLQPDWRRGRCGEWANAFLLCCRAAGLTARYASDWADHVWTEYYSHSMRRWIHLDSCEASYDQPLLYEAGWGKHVSYVLAAGVWGVVDITLRYTARRRRDVVSGRALVPERWLEQLVDEMTTARRAGWAAPRRRVWLGRDAEERVELLRQRREPRPAGGGPPAQPLPGRQTGSVEWRQQRGETGEASAAPPPAAAAATPTSYRLAPEGAAQLLPPGCTAAGRLAGGACRAAGHNETQEVVDRLFDGRAATKWLDFNGGGPGGTSWLEYRLPADLPAVVLCGYELLAANDCPERDPACWQLEGVTQLDFAEGRLDQWTSLDLRSEVRFPARHAALAFQLPAPSPPCRRLRLTITATADPRAANSVQLSCWNLYGGAEQAREADGSGSDPLRRLRDAVAAAAAGEPVERADSAALALLERVLEAIRREPRDVRLRKVRGAKVPSLLQSPPLQAVLLSYLRFRPVLMPISGGGAQAAKLPGVPAGEDVFLVLATDANGDDLRRVSEVLSILMK